MDGRVAVVTGASAGIGADCARLFASRGVRTVGVARREGRLAAIADELNGNGERVFAPFVGDVTEPTSVDRALDFAKSTFGTEPDTMVVNAGRGLTGSVLQSDERLWAETFEVDCLAALRQLRAAAARFISSDHGGARDIVVVGSVVGRYVSPFNPVYGAAKFALHSAAEALRQEIARHGVRVTVVEPGIVKTDFQTTASYDMAAFEAYEKEIGPFLNGTDIAELIAFSISRPTHVSIGNIIVRPTGQATP